MATTLVTGYLPGSIGRVSELHGVYYHEHAGFGRYFEAKVASELSEFLGRYDETRDGLWLVLADGSVEGSIAIDSIDMTTEGAHLRWFIMSDRLRGSGFGNMLLTTAVDFCRARQYPRVYLWTFEGLNAARHLYATHGFQLVRQQRGTQWGPEVP